MRKARDIRMGYNSQQQVSNEPYKLIEFDTSEINPNFTIASSPPVVITSPNELKTRLAYLSQGNPDLKLLFRGQDEDYQSLDTEYQNFQNNGATRTRSSLYPTLFREIFDLKNGEFFNPPSVTLAGHGQVPIDEFVAEFQEGSIRFLEFASSHGKKINSWNFEDVLQQFAILQHYEVIPTLMLDVTSEINTAMSFGYDETTKKCFLYVFGVPYRGEAISVFPKDDLLVIDLSRLMPPEALRPHYQSGFVLTAHPAIYQKVDGLMLRVGTINYMPSKNVWDFSRFLLAKFELAGEFWESELSPKLSPVRSYFPDKSDPMFDLCNDVRTSIRLYSVNPK